MVLHGTPKKNLGGNGTPRYSQVLPGTPRAERAKKIFPNLGINYQIWAIKLPNLGKNFQIRKFRAQSARRKILEVLNGTPGYSQVLPKKNPPLYGTPWYSMVLGKKWYSRYSRYPSYPRYRRYRVSAWVHVSGCWSQDARSNREGCAPPTPW